MSQKKAVLIFDPNRRPEQLAYVSARTEILHQVGERVWVAVTESQAERFTGQGITVQFHETLDTIVLPALVFDPVQGVPTPPPGLAAAMPGDDHQAHYLVQFITPPEPAWLYAISSLGGSYIQNLPINITVFRLSGGTAAQVGQLPYVRWVGPYHPAYALDYRLAGLDYPFTPTSLANLAIDSSRLSANELGNIQIQFFDDVDPETVRPDIENSGAQIILESGYGYILKATAEGLPALLRLPGLFSLEPYAPPEPEVSRGRFILNTEQVAHAGNSGFLVNLRGDGEIVAVIDTGLDHGDATRLDQIHLDVRGRVLAIDHLLAPGTAVADTNGHGSHVTGIIAGDGAASEGQIKGVAPACYVYFQGPTQVGGAAVVAFLRAHLAGARVHHNSWGDPTGVTGNNLYQQVAQRIDQFCYLYPDSLVVFSAGNDETDTQAGGDGILDMNQLKPEKPAKNILVVGATESLRDNDGYGDNYRSFFSTRYNHLDLAGLAARPAGEYSMSDNADQMALFSSRGPINHLLPALPGPPIVTPTGRVKPDLVAPGTNIIAMRSSLEPAQNDWSDPSTVSEEHYTIKLGTSMAAPHVSGAAILTRQYYRARFGQLRRPILLEGVSPNVSPPPDFVDLPAVAQHSDGLIFVWVTPAAADSQKKIVASVFSRSLAQLNTAPIQLQADVGGNPAPKAARFGDQTLLLHRHKDGRLLLSRYRKDPPPGLNLSLDPNFNTSGIVPVITTVDSDQARPPAMLVVGDDVALVWTDSSQSLQWRRYQATDGQPRGSNPVTLGNVTQTSPYPYMVHNGSHYAMVWINQADSMKRVLFRMVDNDGQVVGDEPLTVMGVADLGDAHLAWDSRAGRFAVVWVENRETGGQILLRFLTAEGALLPDVVGVVSVPAGQVVRRPFIAAHPTTGYVLAWEDNSQNGQFDVYCTFLDGHGRPDRRIREDPHDPASRPLSRVSDTPQDTQGLAALVDQSGLVIVWQSLDEINSDTLNILMLNITLEGAFQAQADPRTPLINSGKYIAHALTEHTITSLDTIAMTWAGGDYYLLRWDGGQALAASQLSLIKTNADGLADLTYGANGARALSLDLFHRRCEMLWQGNVLACVAAGMLANVSVYLFDANGNPADGSHPPTVAFGAAGVRQINEFGHEQVSPQLGYLPLPAPNFGIIVVYGTGQILMPTANKIRYAILDRQGRFINRLGNPIAGPVDLVTAPSPTASLSTARHGWFHFVGEENLAIAAWHQRAGLAATDHEDVFINRFDPGGAAMGDGVTAAPIPLLPLPRSAGDASDSRNAVIAPRPVGINAASSLQREYGVAWQYRVDNTQPWEIRFSRLQRNGRVRPNPAAPDPPANNVRVIFPGKVDAAGTAIWPPVPGAAMHAIEPQLVCTYTDARWRPTPGPATPAATIWNQWSPGYGLAWLGQPAAGGNRALYFTVLDENGNLLRLDPQPVVAAPPTTTTPIASIMQISRPGAEVKDFKLIWNGRTFRLTWTEVEAGKIRHIQTALTRHGRKDVYDQPSAALLRATLINGATNINNTNLPNIPTGPITNDNRNYGYGWGRVNLRQALAPSAPVTFYVRDDGAVGPGATARYRFYLPSQTKLLRLTLTWNDPPGPLLINNLHLQVTVRATGQIYHGNTWQATAGNGWKSQPVAAGAPFDNAQNVEQCVIQDPPSGEYEVEVIAQPFPANPLNQFPAQPFALIFVGSGPETRFRLSSPCDLPFH